MIWLLAAAGAVLVFEGLVLSLMPARLEDVVRMLTQLPVETRRLIGLTGMATGLALLSAARVLSGA